MQFRVCQGGATRAPGFAASFAASLVTAVAAASGAEWRTVVNNGQLMPGSDKFFNSYNQPSINGRGLVAFRARSKGPEQPVRGIYTLDILAKSPVIGVVAAVSGEVPQPNNIEYPPGSGELATFREFPSFPRIDDGSDMIATRGQSQPVWNYLLPDATETSVGTAGIYATVDGVLATGVSLLGAVADAGTGALVFPWWQVPGTAPGTRFDQFPGSAAACDGEFIAFKGNYTEVATGLGRTGVYYRSMLADGGEAPVVLIADALTPIPNQSSKSPVNFGSTAPPSAADGRMVFVGLDNEEAPTMGGIYLAPLAPTPELTTLIEIGSPVPGEAETERFNRIGEALSFDGRWLAFWGAWGEETRDLLLTCPVDGEAEVIAYCNEMYPDGLTVQVPVRQGMFAIDTLSGRLVTIAKTGAGIDDLLYWNFSGSPPQKGGGDEGGEQEPPRWRSTAFVAIDGTERGAFRAVFKAKLGMADAIMLRVGPADGDPEIVVSTVTPGTELDGAAPVGSLVSAVGIERDGLRSGRLALVASMLDAVTTEAWAGIYARELPPIPTCEGDLNGDGAVDAVDLASLLVAWGECRDCFADIDGDGLVDGRDIAAVLNAWGRCD
ncbi:MAG: hypothetical protein RL354_1803 [Planctomycetota bacterium]|jgi:hypothetical protein